MISFFFSLKQKVPKEKTNQLIKQKNPITQNLNNCIDKSKLYKNIMDQKIKNKTSKNCTASSLAFFP